MIKKFIFIVVVFFAFSVEAQTKNVLRDSVGGDDKSPIFINSDNLSANSEKRVFVYTGNVELRRGDVFATSDKLIGFYDVNNKIETIVFERNVVITRGEGMRASSGRAEYDMKSGIIEMTENPELAQIGNVLTADKVLLFVAENRSEAVGNVRVKLIQDGSSKVSLEALGSSKSK